MEKIKLYINKLTENAIIPEIAYNGTSAAFDITCTKKTVIPANGSASIPNGLRLSIDEKEPYYMTIHLRSSLGFKFDLSNHLGIIDAGYCGDLGIKVYNLSGKEFTINEGERYAQILIHKKIPFEFVELNNEDFEEFSKRQKRGSKGFGSSGK